MALDTKARQREGFPRKALVSVLPPLRLLAHWHHLPKALSCEQATRGLAEGTVVLRVTLGAGADGRPIPKRSRTSRGSMDD